MRGKAAGNVGQMQGVDEMSTEVMENAANAAAKRREIRNRRILMDPDARMRKLTGYNNANQEAGQMPPDYPGYSTGPLTTGNSHTLTGLEAEPNMFSRTKPPTSENYLYDNQYTPSATTTSGFHAPPSQGTEANLTDLFQTLSGLTQTGPGGVGVVQPTVPARPVQSSGFTRVRWLLILLLGIIVRVSLVYSLGRRFIQSIINPFVFIEIAFLGYQRAVGMDMGSNIKGGMWLSTLVLSGIKPEVIDSYKLVMGIVTAVIDDFSLFFFAFVIVHLVCLPFV